MAMRRLFRKADEFETLFWAGENISNLYKRINERADHPMARIFLAGKREWVKTSSDGNEKKIKGSGNGPIDSIYKWTIKQFRYFN